MNQAPQNPMPAQRPCPGCGVPVAAGYARCPRCQSLMPDAPRSVPRRHQTYASLGGGTSVASSRRGTLLIAAGAVAALVIALIIVLLVRGGGDEPETAELDDDTAVEAAAPDLVTAADSEPSSLPPPSPSSAEPEPSLDDVVASLTSELRRQRMWATVAIDRADRSIIVIQSALCEDRTLVQVVAEVKSDAARRGGTVIRCVAKHGAVVFEEVL